MNVMLAMRSPEFLPESLTRLLFETQIWYWAFGIGAGVLLFVAGRNRASKPLIRSSIVIATITLIWMLLAWLVVTPTERLYATHAQLAATIQDKNRQNETKGDLKQIFSYLTNDFECPQLGIKNLTEAKSLITAGLNQFHIKSNHIRAYQLQISNKTAQTQVTFLTESDTGWTKTSWKLRWQDIAGDDWKLRTAELKTLNDSPVDTLDLQAQGLQSLGF
ncbi:MAG: hypothetical protein FWD61_08590 [Phycisphaerales bacterium]|nr:hypothetical protein [Phycisphaerales bacterium]